MGSWGRHDGDEVATKMAVRGDSNVQNPRVRVADSGFLDDERASGFDLAGYSEVLDLIERPGW